MEIFWKYFGNRTSILWKRPSFFNGIPVKTVAKAMLPGVFSVLSFKPARTGLSYRFSSTEIYEEEI